MNCVKHYKTNKDKKHILLSYACTSYTYPTSFYEEMSMCHVKPFHIYPFYAKRWIEAMCYNSPNGMKEIR